MIGDPSTIGGESCPRQDRVRDILHEAIESAVIACPPWEMLPLVQQEAAKHRCPIRGHDRFQHGRPGRRQDRVVPTAICGAQHGRSHRLGHVPKQQVLSIGRPFGDGRAPTAPLVPRAPTRTRWRDPTRTATGDARRYPGPSLVQRDPRCHFRHDVTRISRARISQASTNSAHTRSSSILVRDVGHPHIALSILNDEVERVGAHGEVRAVRRSRQVRKRDNHACPAARCGHRI